MGESFSKDLVIDQLLGKIPFTLVVCLKLGNHFELECDYFPSISFSTRASVHHFEGDRFNTRGSCEARRARARLHTTKIVDWENMTVLISSKVVCYLR